MQIDWFAPNGKKVGIADRNMRVGHYTNGTAVLQIAAFRLLNSCDGGVYTCVANDSSTLTEERKNFTLLVGCKFVMVHICGHYYTSVRIRSEVYGGLLVCMFVCLCITALRLSA